MVEGRRTSLETACLHCTTEDKEGLLGLQCQEREYRAWQDTATSYTGKGHVCGLHAPTFGHLMLKLCSSSQRQWGMRETEWVGDGGWVDQMRSDRCFVKKSRVMNCLCVTVHDREVVTH